VEKEINMMTQWFWKNAFLSFVSFIFCLSVLLVASPSRAMKMAPESGVSMSSSPHFSDIATHGMVAFGGAVVYLSHLPMFHSPHDEQAIFEVTFDGDGTKAYSQAKSSNKDALVTIVPQPFSLLAMIAQPKDFKADIFAGHFERGGQIVAAGIHVHVVQVVYAHHIGDPPMDPQTDIEFGKAGDAQYKSHYIRAAPDFDQINRIDPKTGLSEIIYREDEDLAE
jgi:hypothetical protein